jgi:hypothetical protein
MRLIKLSIIMAAALGLSLAHAAESKDAAKEKNSPPAASAASVGEINLVVSGMT